MMHDVAVKINRGDVLQLLMELKSEGRSEDDVLGVLKRISQSSINYEHRKLASDALMAYSSGV